MIASRCSFRVEGAARRGPLPRCCFRLAAQVRGPSSLSRTAQQVRGAVGETRRLAAIHNADDAADLLSEVGFERSAAARAHFVWIELMDEDVQEHAGAFLFGVAFGVLVARREMAEAASLGRVAQVNNLARASSESSQQGGVCGDPYTREIMTLQSSDAQRYVDRLRYHDRRGDDPERVAGLAGAITFDIESGPQDYLQGRGVPLPQWLSLLDDADRLARVSKLSVRLEDLNPAESDLHARVLADAQLHRASGIPHA